MSVNLLLILFVLVVVAMIAIILVQKGAGATAGSAFGAGASATVFGAKGSGNFLTKTTMLLAFLFFAISMFMAVQASKEFTVAETGEIDLGVLGTLDTSQTDVPALKADNNDAAQQQQDVPVLANTLENNSQDGSTVVVEPEKLEELLNQAEAVKDEVEQKAEEIQAEATDAVEEIEENLN